MTAALESSLWYKQKSPLVNEYLQTFKQVEDQAAKQGFLYRPGFLHDMTTRVETSLKYKLSDVNYQIVQQALERELAQAGHEFDVAIKDAMIAWELEKAQTLTALEQEFANNKLLRQLDKEELDRMRDQINLRQLVIIAMKADYEMEMEMIRRQFFDVERMTFGYESQLLNAKMLTAQKKLEVIPYIEIVLEKQYDIIAEEQNNASKKETLIDKKEEIVEAKRDVIEASRSLFERLQELIAAKESLIAAKQGIITARELLNVQKTMNLTYFIDYIAALDLLMDDKQAVALEKRSNLLFMTPYMDALNNLAEARKALAESKNDNLEFLNDYIEKIEELSNSKRDIATERQSNLLLLDNYMEKMDDLIRKREELIDVKEGNIPFIEQHILAMEDVLDAQNTLLDAKIDLLPKLNEKAAKQMEYVSAMETWLEVKHAINASKGIAIDWKVAQMGQEETNFDLSSELEDSRETLERTKLELEQSKLNARKDLLAQQISNAAIMLEKKEISFGERIERETELFDEEVAFDKFREDQEFKLMKDINDYVIPKENEKIEKIALAKINERGEIAEITANKQVTSQLVHLLA